MDRNMLLKAQRFGEMLTVIRERRGYSRAELAKQACLDPNTLAEVEKGKCEPSPEVKRALEKALGFTLHFEDHKQVAVRVRNQEAQIDEDIAPLIREMWIAGIETLMSCQQDSRGMIRIAVPNLWDLQEFLYIVAKYEKNHNSLYKRMNPQWDNPGRVPAWEYEIFVDDFARVEEEISGTLVVERYEPPSEFFFEFSVCFPPEDLKTVIKRLKKHNRKLASSHANGHRLQEGPAA